MMPTPEEKWEQQRDERLRRFIPRAPEPPAAPPPQLTLAQQEARAARQWARERTARIRAGACPACAERLCPRVGGPDRECVPA
jgi:hypothetical protein